jgi:hypothetical protein
LDLTVPNLGDSRGWWWTDCRWCTWWGRGWWWRRTIRRTRWFPLWFPLAGCFLWFADREIPFAFIAFRRCRFGFWFANVRTGFPIAHLII